MVVKNVDVVRNMLETPHRGKIEVALLLVVLSTINVSKGFGVKLEDA